MLTILHRSNWNGSRRGWPWRAACLGILLGLCNPAFAADATSPPAPRLLITNLLQLHQIVVTNWRVRCDLELEGIVCASSSSPDGVVLLDGADAELLALDLKGKNLLPGQRIALSGRDCEVTRRRMELALGRAPLVDNDGRHEAIEKSGTMELPAGRHPLRVEWFNGLGEAVLSVGWGAPGQPVQKIPDELLSHPSGAGASEPGRPLPGLGYQAYRGDWLSLPDFGRWPVAESGRVANFDLSVRPQPDLAGMVFSGYFQVKQPGQHTFTLKSDDGSRLILGEPLPDITILENGPVPSPVNLFIGQIFYTRDIHRWVAAEGDVGHIVLDAGRLEFELRSRGNSRLQIEIQNAAGLPLALLKNSKVRVRGVSRNAVLSGGQNFFALLSGASASQIQFLNVAGAVWSAHPVRPLRDWAGDPGVLESTIVHLSGSLLSGGSNQPLRLVDGTGAVLVESTPQTVALQDEKVEALGLLSREGTNLVLNWPCLRKLQPPVEPEENPLPLLTSAEQVLRLSREEAARGYRVLLRGVVTCLWPESRRDLVLQDTTRGVFLQLPAGFVEGAPEIGDFWEAEGVTAAGLFSPMVNVSRLTRIGEGRLPDPEHPTWDQLINGSMDAQFVELEGIVTRVEGQTVTLLTHWGKITLEISARRSASIHPFENRLVRIQGCLLARWDPKTRQVKLGQMRIGSATLSADQRVTSDAFAGPWKSAGDLLMFDVQAGAFQRVRMRGQVVARRGGEFFMMEGGAGVRFVARESGDVVPGDLVEVAGFPELGGPSPMLREAVVRRTGSAPLPPPHPVEAVDLQRSEHDATRVRIEGVLVNFRPGHPGWVLEMQAGLRTFVAHWMPPAPETLSLSPGSRLELTGVYAGSGGNRALGQGIESFELLMSGSEGVRVLSEPPWWTLRRLLSVVAMLVGGLILALLWIKQLRRKVEERTAQLQREITERERAERHAAVEAERSRIARDLHDELGSSLTEISMLGNMGQAGGAAGSVADCFPLIVKKARESVDALDVIVWAVNPRENTLQSLADYLASFADEFLAASGINCRIRMPVRFPAVTLDGRTRHELFLATKEALNNAVRHAQASEVEIGMELKGRQLAISVADNGAGFDASVRSSRGDGLANMTSRLAKLHGRCLIRSQPGGGSVVTLELDLPATPVAVPG